MKKRVAIIGSDLTRNLFDDSESQINECFEVSLYRRNASLISIMAQPIDYSFKHLNANLAAEEQQQILDELDKDTLNSLIAVQPEVIILDFYNDVNNGVVKTSSGSFLTNSIEEMSEAYALAADELSESLNSYRTVQDFIQYSKIWSTAFDKFLDFVQQYLPNSSLLINTIDLGKEIPSANNKSEAWFRFNEYAKIKKIPIINADILEACRVIFKEPKLQDLSTIPTLLEKEELPPISEASLNWNLIRNADFSQGKKFWYDDSDEYHVESDVLEIQRQTMEGFTILHSAPIEISNTENDIQRFELSLDAWVENLFALHLNDAFFYVWVYDDKVNRVLKETKIYSSKLENLSSGKWKHITIELECEGKYIELGPHMVGAGHFKYRNLELHLIDE